MSVQVPPSNHHHHPVPKRDRPEAVGPGSGDFCHHHGHHHGLGDHHHHIDPRSVEKRRLLLCIGLTLTTMVVEIVWGLLTNSLALISDGLHMFTHSFALLVSVGAMIVAGRKPTRIYTYGLYRLEILAALVNGLVLAAVTLLIVWEAFHRMMAPPRVDTGTMLIVAFIGLLVNLLTTGILFRSRHADLNTRSAFLHMLGDTLSSVAIVGGGLFMMGTGYWIIDPVLSVGISLLIGLWSVDLIRSSGRVLLEGAPAGMAIEAIDRDLVSHSPVPIDIEDSHLWEITSDMPIYTAHIRLSGSGEDGIRVVAALTERLQSEYGIFHSTIQVGSSSAKS